MNLILDVTQAIGPVQLSLKFIVGARTSSLAGLLCSTMPSSWYKSFNYNTFRGDLKMSEFHDILWQQDYATEHAAMVVPWIVEGILSCPCLYQ